MLRISALASKTTSLFILGALLLGALTPSCSPGQDYFDGSCEEKCPDCSSSQGFDLQYTSTCAAEARPFCSPLSSSGALEGDCLTPEVDIEEITIAEIHAGLTRGDFDCQWLTEAHLARTLWLDFSLRDGQPPLNAMVSLNEGVLERAQQLDDYHRCEDQLAGPLHCVPFVIKTNYASQEVPLTAGSLSLLEAQPDFDAFTVRELRRAGALLLGSTTMDEFARGAQSISGRTGKTGNAYDRRYNPGGSSSGSAVAVASNFASVGLGTDNCSSLTVPAAFNGLATIRSSFGLVSTAGIFPSNSIDVVAGPMTRTIEDLALVMDVLATFNPKDPVHCEGAYGFSGSGEGRYSNQLRSDGLEGKRIGVLRGLPAGDRNFYAGSAQVRAHYDAFFDELRELGAEVIDPIDLPGLPVERRSTGMGSQVDRFLARTTGGVTSVEELCATERYSFSTFDDEANCIRYNRSPDAVFLSRRASGLEVYESNRAYVEEVMRTRRLDALVYPADASGAPRVSGLNSNCVLASITGLPTIVVPTGFTTSGLPIGMTFTGPFLSDESLFAMASAYEQGTSHRRPPTLPAIPSAVAPPLDMESFNDLSYALGLRVWERVLRQEDRSTLTADRMRALTTELLEEEDLHSLLP